MAERLGEWAERKRIHPKTAYKMYREGRMPVPVERFSERVILVHDPDQGKAAVKGRVVVYARVSGHDQKADLDGQVSRIVQALTKQGLAPDEVVTEVGSGLNDNRPKYVKLLEGTENAIIAVEHRERLTSFGFPTVERLLKAQGRRVIVINPKEVESDSVRDMTELLTSFAGRLYGQRSAKNRAEKAVKSLKDN